MIHGVKALSESGIESVPSIYVRRNGFDPAASEIANLPVLDLSKDDTSVAQELHKACQEWGVFQVVGHGISHELMKNVANLGRDFFNMPYEKRIEYYSEDTTKPFRFGSGGVKESGDESRQWLDYLSHIFPLKEDTVPRDIPNYWECLSNYSEQVNTLAKKLMGRFCETLGTDELQLAMGDVTQGYTVRINYYPPCPNPQFVPGSQPHSDPGGFTILQPDTEVDGLQVYHDGKWKLAKALPGAFIVNIADQMEILTNGKYKSLLHRVTLNTSRARVSVVSFYYPQGSHVISPLGSLVEDKVHYKGMTFGDYLKTYKRRVHTSEPAIQFNKV